MRNLPIDTRSMSFLCVGESDVKADRDTGEVKTDDSGAQLHQVDLVAMFNPALPGQRAEVIRVTSALLKNVAPGASVQCLGLTVSPWSIDGRAGLSYRATEIRQTTPSSNGHVAAAPGEIAKVAK